MKQSILGSAALSVGSVGSVEVLFVGCVVGSVISLVIPCLHSTVLPFDVGSVVSLPVVSSVLSLLVVGSVVILLVVESAVLLLVVSISLVFTSGVKVEPMPKLSLVVKSSTMAENKLSKDIRKIIYQNPKLGCSVTVF